VRYGLPLPLIIPLVAGLVSCGDGEPEVVRKVIGAEGGLITSYDDRLTIVLQPGAVSDDTEITIFPSDVPPSIYGAAYRVQPDIELNVAAEVTYRRPLPPIEPKAVAVAAVRTDDFVMGTGFWQPLPRLFIDLDQDSVTCKDDSLSLYYGMFDYNEVPEGGGGGVCAINASQCFVANVFATGAGPRDVCFGDFDGSGVADVATANGAGGTVSIMLGSITGALAAPVSINVGASPSSIACGNITADAFSDFVVALEGAASVAMGISDGGTSFSVSTVDVSAAPVDISLADLNADSFPEVQVVGAAGADALALNAEFELGLAGTQPVELVVPKSGVAAGNFSASGPSVAVFGGATVSIGASDGAGGFGGFGEGTTSTVGSGLARGVAADVTGDGIDDLLIADATMGGVHILQSAGDGVTFSALFSPSGPGAADVAVGDFDGDGVRADLAVANATDGTISVIVRVGANFTNAGVLVAGGSPSGVDVADLNNDGIDDIVASNESDDSVTLFLSRRP